VARAIVRQLNTNSSTVDVSSGDIVFGRAGTGTGGRHVPLDLGGLQPVTISRRLLVVRSTAQTVFVESGRGGGAMPIVWRRSEHNDVWLPLGALNRSMALASGFYQVVVTPRGATAGLDITISVSGSTLPASTPVDGVDPPALTVHALEKSWHYLYVAYGLLARVGCAPSDHTRIRRALATAMRRNDRPEPGEAFVRNAINKIGSLIAQANGATDAKATVLLSRIPYQSVDDSIRHDWRLKALVECLPQLAAGDPEVCRLRHPATAQ
jgi:hypothetical protein